MKSNEIALFTSSFTLLTKLDITRFASSVQFSPHSENIMPLSTPAEISRARSRSWFCHECRSEFSSPWSPEPKCLHCFSTFVEEIESGRNDDDDVRMWTLGNHQSSRNPHTVLPHQDDSPPIPGTRQRYDQLQREQRESEAQSSSGNLLEPLLNIFGIHPPTDPNLSHDEPQRRRNEATVRRDPRHGRSNPRPARINLPGILRRNNTGSSSPAHEGGFSAEPPAQGHSAPTQGPRTHNSNGSLSRSDNEGEISRRSGRFGAGVYTFTFDSRTPTQIFGFRPAQPTDAQLRSNDMHVFENQPGNPSDADNHSPAGAPSAPAGFFSLVQHVLGHASQNASPAPETRPGFVQSPSPGQGPSDAPINRRQSPGSGDGNGLAAEDPSSNSDFNWTDDGEHFRTGSAFNAPGVNLEESHPLRQFLNLIGSINTQNMAAREGGFIIGGGFVGGSGSRFDFTTSSRAGAATLGDYVFGDSAMQDILNQLVSMAGAGGGPEPIPASEETIRSMKQFKFTCSQSGELEECAICKDNFATEDDCMELPCTHFFHSDQCIKPWLKQNGTCPVCRFSLVNPPGAPNPDSSHSSRNAQPEVSPSSSFHQSSGSTPAVSNNDPRSNHNEGDYYFVEPGFDVD